MAMHMARAGQRPTADDGHSVVVFVSKPIRGRGLVEEIARHARGPGDDVVVVAPASIDSALKLGAGEVDAARAEAGRGLLTSLEALRRAGLHASGQVGDADPTIALADALRSSSADEVIISAHLGEEAVWLETEVIERARRELNKPITEVLVEAGPMESVREVRALSPLEADGEQQGDYLPPLPLRDRVALLVGICGTITLGVLAMFAPGNPHGSFTTAFAVRFLIATGAFMVTLWHAVALLVFGSVGYRGKWETLAADLVLFGVPAAIVLSLIVGYIFPTGAY